MGKTKREIGSASDLSFHKHYSAIWGEERWHNRLYPALAEPTRYTALVNRFSSLSAFSTCLTTDCPIEELEQLRFPTAGAGTFHSGEYDALLCLVRRLGNGHPSQDAISDYWRSLLPPPRLATSPRTGGGIVTHWNLDAASVLAGHLLNIRPGDHVLDLCAAPGGKSIAIAQKLFPQLHQENHIENNSTTTAPSGSLTSNEADATRFRRLNENLKSYIPPHLFANKQVNPTQIDGTDAMACRKLSPGSGSYYDKVLVDAPCSSERHVTHAHHAAKAAGRTTPEMTNWRPGSSKRMAKTQTELLITGLKAAKVGGRVLYATCSIEMCENDGVVEKVLAWVEKETRKGMKWGVRVGFNGGVGDVRLEEELERDWAERTRFGWIVLPDHHGGGRWGPLFFAVFTKVGVSG